jgi:hypothetical protein
VIGGSTRHRGPHALEPKRVQVQLFDEDFDHPNRVVLGHVIVEQVRQQQRLASF